MEVAPQVALPAPKEPAALSHRLGVAGGRRQPFDARALATLDIKLKTSARVVARQVHRAGGHKETAMDQVHDAIREPRGKIRPEINRAVLLQPPGHIKAREAFLKGQLDVGGSFVIPQENVIARLEPLDQ